MELAFVVVAAVSFWLGKCYGYHYHPAQSFMRATRKAFIRAEKAKAN